ncbi:MAG: hypothetical protein M0R28_21135 [Pigmentiphaga sp.]|nr:hypothetical protein [Pigmentiphaga sp.]
MAIPPEGWTAAPQRAPLVDVPLPAREEFTYTSFEDHPPLIDQWDLPLDKLTWGGAGAEAVEGFTEKNTLVKEATLWVESAYAVTLIDAFLLVAPLEKGWLFTVDGHVFYVLNFVLGRTLIYDFTTQQWHKWYTAGRPFWNVFRGINWNGKVIGADAETAQIWEVDMESELDQEALPITRVVSGFQAVEGLGSVRQGALRITARRGDLLEGGATVQMRFSDDGGKTWSQLYSFDLQDTNASQRIEWRSLGRLRAPGRIWEIYDSGGLVRIDGADGEIS